METNFFHFTGDTATEPAFLYWCLNWFHDKSGQNKELFSMAKGILTYIDGDSWDDEEEVEFYCRTISSADVMAYRKKKNRMLILSRFATADHERQIKWFRKQIIERSNIVEEESSLEICFIFFSTSYFFGIDRVGQADKKIDGETFLSILEKYEGINQSVDLYIDGLRGRISREKEEGDFQKIDSDGKFIDWSICRSRIAQDRFMREMFGEKYPESMWRKFSACNMGLFFGRKLSE